MDSFIARENIKRFEAQLANCTDESQRQVLTRLLELEKQRLRDMPPDFEPPRALPDAGRV